VIAREITDGSSRRGGWRLQGRSRAVAAMERFALSTKPGVDIPNPWSFLNRPAPVLIPPRRSKNK